ncbi:MAG: group II intron reverse transcriptase/maturase [Elainellaceae cyanobacterium]
MTAHTRMAGNGTGAPFGDSTNWMDLDWSKIRRSVRRLQARIVKAVQAERWGKVNALQRLLCHSFSAKALAVRRVTENKGKRTPGVDGECWSNPQQKAEAIKRLRQRGYRAQPLRRVYIPKANGKRRALGIPTMRDRAMQALYLLGLEPICETTADGNSYGFRAQRSTADAIEQARTVLMLKTSAQWVLDADIEGCFDHISHDWLMTHVPMDKRILRQWLQAGFVETGQWFATEAGTPQGGIISPVLANLALDSLEPLLRGHFRQRKHPPYYNPKVNLIRYCDDFVVTGYSKELLEHQVTPLIESFLAQRGLRLSPQKTRIVSITDGFDFLGQHLRKVDGRLRIRPAKGNIKAFLTKVRTLIKAHKAAPAAALIARLNPLIRGWALYHRHIPTSATFAKVAHHIFCALWRWAKRRHPNKSKRWVKHKYFYTLGNNHWVFAAPIPTDGQCQLYTLVQLNQFRWHKHIKVKGAANPFDPLWQMYFEHRWTQQLLVHPLRSRRVKSLWHSQQGVCPHCRAQLSLDEPWHLHHRLPRAAGGSDNLSNLVLLHPDCHRQLHHHLSG